MSLVDRDIQHLYPNFRYRYVDVLSDLEQRDIPLRCYETFRGKTRQERGVSTGKSKAHYMQSMHQYGIAADTVGWVDGKWSWDNSLPWKRYGKIVDDHGLIWAGHWKSFREMVHCQLGEFTYAQLRNGIQAEPEACDYPHLWLDWYRWWLPMIYDTDVGVACVQRGCVQLGEDPGPIDGMFGPKTGRAFGKVLGIKNHDYLMSRQAMQDLLTRLEEEEVWNG